MGTVLGCSYWGNSNAYGVRTGEPTSDWEGLTNDTVRSMHLRHIPRSIDEV